MSNIKTHCCKKSDKYEVTYHGGLLLAGTNGTNKPSVSGPSVKIPTQFKLEFKVFLKIRQAVWQRTSSASTSSTSRKSKSFQAARARHLSI